MRFQTPNGNYAADFTDKNALARLCDKQLSDGDLDVRADRLQIVSTESKIPGWSETYRVELMGSGLVLGYIDTRP